MKIKNMLKKILASIVDPISIFHNSSFFTKLYKLVGKNIFIQLGLAFIVTIIVLLLTKLW